jgi:amino acid adenylation domain-containing protein
VSSGRVDELIERQAAARAECVALVAGDGFWTYGEVERRAHRLAQRLRGLGTARETVVGVALERSAELVLALFAVWKAGGAALLLDPAWPPSRLAQVTDDAGARLVLSRTGDELRLAGARELAARVAAESSGAVGNASRAAAESGAAARGQAAELAYVIFTSGSTARPKGVGVEHGALAYHLTTVFETYGLRPGERVLQFAAPVFDIALEEMLAPLVCGATLVLRDPELPHPGELLAILAAHAITVLYLPTAYWQVWVREVATRPLPEPLPLRLVSTGGEAMLPQVAALWRGSELRQFELLNLYGPTEAVISATFQAISDEVLPGPAAMPIGRPHRGRSAHVVDRGGQPVPAGVAGELLLGGVLARGYLRSPAETAERFIPDPFSGLPGRRLYRTGDLTRWRAGGLLDFLGRIDHQVKVRGVRIEPGEVEAALMAHPGVAAAAVVPVAGAADELRLAAFVVPAAGASPAAGELRELLLRALPAAVVPATIERLAALPMTGSGKVDRRALAAAAARPAPATFYVAPESEIERTLAELWRQELGVERVGRYDSFFELGGHSLLMLRLYGRIRQCYATAPPMIELFELPTLAAMARRLAGETNAAALGPGRAGARLARRGRAARRRAPAASEAEPSAGEPEPGAGESAPRPGELELSPATPSPPIREPELAPGRPETPLHGPELAVGERLERTGMAIERSSAGEGNRDGG